MWRGRSPAKARAAPQVLRVMAHETGAAAEGDRGRGGAGGAEEEDGAATTPLTAAQADLAIQLVQTLSDAVKVTEREPVLP